MKYIFLIILIFIALPVEAQVPFDFNVPEPIRNFFETFKRIEINTNSIPFANEIVSEAKTAVSEPGEFLSRTKGWWNNINQWLENSIGLNFIEILKSVGNLFIWALELIIKVMKFALSFIS